MHFLYWPVSYFRKINSAGGPCAVCFYQRKSTTNVYGGGGYRWREQVSTDLVSPVPQTNLDFERLSVMNSSVLKGQISVAVSVTNSSWLKVQLIYQCDTNWSKVDHNYYKSLLVVKSASNFWTHHGLIVLFYLILWSEHNIVFMKLVYSLTLLVFYFLRIYFVVCFIPTVYRMCIL